LSKEKEMIKINEKITAEYLFSRGSFPGVMIASDERLIEAEDSFVENAEKEAKQNEPHEPLQSIRKYNENGVLKPRANMGLLMKFEGKGEDYTSKCMSVVWFDDTEISIEDSLKNILDEIDWGKARDFDF
jgi:hypothetical protein